MATFLSPGVFPREIDLSLVPNIWATLSLTTWKKVISAI
jgi:hypothetical protein